MTAQSEPPTESFDRLSTELISAIRGWRQGTSSWDDEELDDWARRAFRLQFAHNPPYRKYCEARGMSPPQVTGWRDFPPVPTAAFGIVDLVVGRREDAHLTFLTSGTTRGNSAQGRHLVRSADLYRASLRASFERFVLDVDNPPRIVTLPPSFTHDRSSSLGFMLDDLRTGLGAGGGVNVALPDGIDWRLLDEAVEEASDAHRLVYVLGTTLGFAEWLDRLEEGRSVSAALPAGSKLMDTGGEKGRVGVRRSRVVRGLMERLSLPPEAVVNEFGMTELLSQRYGRGEPPVPLIGPPWLRSRVLDPVTLEEVPAGETGILCHFDLANLGSVCAVLTDDRGRLAGEGIEWLGRTEGAPPRGCSLATAQLLEAVDHA